MTHHPHHQPIRTAIPPAPPAPLERSAAVSSGGWTREEDFELIKEMTLGGGKVACSYLKGAIRRWDKSEGNPVSDADIAVNEFLKSALLSRRPEYGWLSEESEDNEDRLSCGRVFVIDPIDGTRSYLSGGQEWGISVALVEYGQPTLAAFYAPLLGDMYTACIGMGAYKNDKPIAVSHVETLNHARMMGDPSSFRSKFWPEPWPEAMQAEQLNSIALRLCKVADGSSDCCVTLRSKNEWDIAAAALILGEAGGTLSDGDGHSFRFNMRQPQHDHIVACNGMLFSPIMKRVSAALRAVRSRCPQQPA